MLIHFFLSCCLIIDDNNEISFYTAEENYEINYDTFPINDFIEDQVFNDDELENRVEIAVEPETKRSTVSNSARVWKFFERKQETLKDTSGNEKITNYILCNVGQCHLSSSNSTTIFERHLKAKHFENYQELQQQLDLKELEP